jgi:chaperonin GroEL
LLRGAARLSWLAALTYGPTPRTVAIQRLVGSGPPEVLDSAATIVRRTIELPDGFENAGAMLVRDTVLRVEERVGDGGALTAVLLHSLLVEATKLLAGGFDPFELRTGLDDGLECARAALRSQARPLDGANAVRALMAGLVNDPPAEELVAEVLDAVGPQGVVLVESGQATETTREYLDGVRWDEGYLSAYFVADGSGVARVLQPCVLVTDIAIERAEQVVPLLEECVASSRRQVFIIAPELRDVAAGVLLANRQRGVLEGVVAVKAPAAYDAQREAILEDLAVLTGGRYVRAAAGDRLERLSAADLGSARQAWARHDAFAILGAAGDRQSIRARALAVRAESGQVRGNPAQRRWLEKRLANLSGVAALVRVGGATDAEREERRLRVDAAMRSGRLALQDGVVPGGGAALLGCAAAIPPRSPAGRVLQRALASPLRMIARLAGFDPSAIAEQASCHPGAGFDVLRRTWTPRLVDPYAVVDAALEASISATSTAISAEAVVRRSA